MVGVAQLVRAPDCGSGCRGFESHLPPHKRGDRGHPGPLFSFPLGRRQVVRQGTLTPSSAGSSPAIPAKHFRMAPHPVIYYAYAPLAQSVEHLPFKQGVWGSNPQRGTKKDATRSGGVFFDAPFVPKGRWPFGTNGFRSEPRVLPAVGGQNTLWPDINRRGCRGQFLWAKACSAQSVFCDVHAAAKNGLHLIRGAAAPRTL